MKKIAALLLLMVSIVGSAQDQPPEGAVWQYSIYPTGIGTAGYFCVINRLPANLATNQAGFAASEGAFFTESSPGLPLLPPSGLAFHILDCLVPSWTDFRFCFQAPTPWYTGFYPNQRIAQINVFMCANPPPQGFMWDYYVTMRREAYFPPPLMSNGFEP